MFGRTSRNDDDKDPHRNSTKNVVYKKCKSCLESPWTSQFENTSATVIFMLKTKRYYSTDKSKVDV